MQKQLKMQPGSTIGKAIGENPKEMDLIIEVLVSLM